MADELILLSACLAGINCVYDGTNKFHPIFAKLYEDKKAVIFCPEVLGGFPIPHAPSEIFEGDGFKVLKSEGRVFSCEGKDVTSCFLKGARKTLELAKKHGIKTAVMKSKSPSCGCGLIFDGTFKGKLVSGFGVTAALLKENGIDVISDIDFLENMK